MPEIRRIRADEGMRLREIRLRALQSAPTAFGTTFAEAVARSDADWHDHARRRSEGENSALFVAELDGGWLGMAGGFLEDDFPGEAQLFSMWVEPEARGTGLGERLVDTVLKWARPVGAETVRLWVTETNAPAIALYRRCGFAMAGETQPLPSHPGLNELLMKRPLA